MRLSSGWRGWNCWWITDVISFRCGKMDFDRSSGVCLVLFRWMVELQVRPHWNLYLGRWDAR